MRVFNTLTRTVETLEPIEPGHVRVYTCGPTVYDFAHIGNFRTYVWEDLLRRTLRHTGFRVTQVMNITDIEDKIIAKAMAQKTTIDAVTAPYIQAFFEDLDTLGIERAEHYPRATEHIPEMIAIAKSLEARGHTYESQGSLYFRIDSFDGYPPANTRSGWKEQVGSTYGLQFWANFARRHHKGFSVPEWAVYSGDEWGRNGGGDNAAYIARMFAFFRRNADVLTYETYFNEPDDYQRGALELNPRAAREYRDQFELTLRRHLCKRCALPHG